jgi:YbbR domain-containing protein
VRRVVARVIHNWPLKVAAILLATLLYAGLTVSQSAQRWDARVPIVPRNQPVDAVLIGLSPTDVTEIRYFAPPDIAAQVSSSTFTAFVDLAGIDPAAGSTFAAVQVVASDPRITIADFKPTSVRVELDPLVTATVPVEVDLGEVPPGLEVGEPEPEVTEVVASGPESAVRRVVAAVARVTIQPSGLDVDQDVRLVPVDAVGAEVTPIDLEPATVRVRIQVGSAEGSKSLPVSPDVGGTPAVGYEVASVAVDPPTITVQGDADALAGLASADTEPISITGATGTLTRTVGLALPEGVDPIGSATVEVTIEIREISASRTYSTGIFLSGARDDRTYTLSTDRVSVVIGGPVASLDALDPTQVRATVDVSALPVGSHQVPVVIGTLAGGLAVLSVTPAEVGVVVGEPIRPSASPSPSPGPSPSPSGVP